MSHTLKTLTFVLEELWKPACQTHHANLLAHQFQSVQQRRRRDDRSAFDAGLRDSLLPDSTLNGSANLLVLPNLDAANILFNVLKMTGGEGVTVGPIAPRQGRSAHPDPLGHSAAHRQT